MAPASLNPSVFPLLKESDLFSGFEVAATIQALQPNAKMFRRIDFLLLCVFLLKIRKHFLEALQQSYPHVSLVRIVSHAYSTNQSLVGRMGFPMVDKLRLTLCPVLKHMAMRRRKETGINTFWGEGKKRGGRNRCLIMSATTLNAFVCGVKAKYL